MLMFIFVLYFSYREKAMQDAATVSKHVECLLQSFGKVFCKPMFSLTIQVNLKKILMILNLGLMKSLCLIGK